MAIKGLKRRAIRRKKGSKPTEYIIPVKKEKGQPYSRSAEYKYFYGHIIPEISKKLPPKHVCCWYNDKVLSLPVCALNKFWREKKYCKRCSLFQDDKYAQELKDLILEWEKDDLENTEDLNGD